MLQSFYHWVTRKNSGVTELEKKNWEELISGTREMGSFFFFKKRKRNIELEVRTVHPSGNAWRTVR